MATPLILDSHLKSIPSGKKQCNTLSEMRDSLWLLNGNTVVFVDGFHNLRIIVLPLKKFVGLWFSSPSPRENPLPLRENETAETKVMDGYVFMGVKKKARESWHRGAIRERLGEHAGKVFLLGLVSTQ